jgi:hypothetical protein
MSFDKFHTNCPHFSVGACVSYKEGKCKYKYHKCCTENFLCDREDCKFGHGITVMKRLIVNKIYDDKYSIKDSVYESSQNRCGMPMNCINAECDCDHHLEKTERAFIYKIANSIVSDEDAWDEYEKLYCSSYSPGSAIMSAGSTIPSLSPCPIMCSTPLSRTVSFASLFKSEASVASSKEDSTDEMVVIMDEMLFISNEISIKNKKVIGIKENIKKLKEELACAEEELKIGKARFKASANKIIES